VYADRIRRILLTQQRCAARLGLPLSGLSPFLQPKESTKNITLILITADIGMCGGYNLQANRLALEFIKARENEGRKVMLLAKGKKGQRYFGKLGYEFVLRQTWSRTGLTEPEVDEILSFATNQFLEGETDEVYCLYTKFFTPIKHQAAIIRMLPLEAEFGDAPEKEVDEWYYEPNLPDLIRELIPIYLKAQIYDVLLESYASEQGARMVAMEEAKERAEEALGECQTLYHRLQREGVTLGLLGTISVSEILADETDEAVQE
jgi:F-type H+-transporting ATPase subunit gamma